MPTSSLYLDSVFRPLGLSLSSLMLTAFSLLATTASVQAAERIFFVYTPLKLSLRVESLELFAKEGKVNNDLGFYFNLANVTPETQTTIRELLNKRAELKDPLYVPRFFNSSTGEALLKEIGTLIAIPWDINGKYAIRAALIESALDPKEGLTLINFLRKYPTNLNLNVERILRAAELINVLGRGTNDLVEKMELLSREEAARQPKIDFAALPDLRQAGPLTVAPEQVWQLIDPKRDRRFRVLVYQPQSLPSAKIPVIVISHGLASRPEDFRDRAIQLASYGYVVAISQHPGSDQRKLKDLLAGYSREVFALEEFIDRPLDVSFVIDELERRNQSSFGGRLDLNAVGVFGHSFGGYTALMVAGAKIDFENLSQECNHDNFSVNLATVLQCRALKLPHQNYDLTDKRVKAIFLANPVSSDIFGPRGLAAVTMPVLMAGGSSDPATPVAIEQLRSFVWLGSADKRFGLVKGQAHVNFNQLSASTKAILDSFGEITVPDQTLIDQYANAYIVAFAKYYLSEDAQAAPYLLPGYALFISQEPNPLYMVDGSADQALVDLYNSHKPSDHSPITATVTEQTQK